MRVVPIAALIIALLLSPCPDSSVLGQTDAARTHGGTVRGTDTADFQERTRHDSAAAAMGARQSATPAPETLPAATPAPSPGRDPLMYLAAGFLCVVGMLMTAGFLVSMRDGGSLAIESHWGGFGGGGGGWRLSRPLSYLIGMLFSVGLLIALVLRESQGPDTARSVSAQSQASTAVSPQPQNITHPDSAEAATPSPAETQ